jgi:nitrite reductase/ring-hydroxylating ferredoxin subunit
MDDTTANWTRIAARSELPDGEVIAVALGDRQIALYNLEGEIFATDNICTHAHACLSEGWLENGVIECPLHQGRFDVRTGKGLGAPIDKDLTTFRVRTEGDDVLVEVTP